MVKGFFADVIKNFTGEIILRANVITGFLKKVGRQSENVKTEAEIKVMCWDMNQRIWPIETGKTKNGFSHIASGRNIALPNHLDSNLQSSEVISLYCLKPLCLWLCIKTATGNESLRCVTWELIAELLKAFFHICKMGIAIIPTAKLPWGLS